MSARAAAPPTRLDALLERAGALHRRLAAIRPRYVLAPLLVVQWLALLAFALTVRHNGWIYYMNGDQLWQYTDAYLLSHGKLATTFVGVGWSTILAPIAWVAGPNLVSALPAIILLNALVLLPVALLCVYGIAERIGGRIFGYWAAVLWIVLPYAGARFALAGYHQKYTELTLPQVLGLGASYDFPSVVALLVGAYLCVRAVEAGHWLWAAGAGFATAYALSIRPSNAVFLVAPAALFLAFRWRALIPFALGLAPPLAVLTLWKIRGFGRLPAFATPPARRTAAGFGDPLEPVRHYTKNNDWNQLHNNLLQLREHVWSERVLEFLAIAGLVALVVRSRRAAVFVGTWFVAFLLLKGTYLGARVEDGSFWRLLMPAFPAFVLLVAAVPLLVPGVRLRPPPLRPPRRPRSRVLVGVTAVACVFVLFPAALVAAAGPIRGHRPAAVGLTFTLVPVSAALGPDARAGPNGVVLSWRGERPGPGKVFYNVYRTPPGSTYCELVAGAQDNCVRPTGSDLQCGVRPHAPDYCFVAPTARVIGQTRQSTWVDRPPPGTWFYRIGVVANWRDSLRYGDVYVFSRVVRVKT